MPPTHLLSVEETVAIVMLANVIVLTPITPQVEYETQMSLEFIVNQFSTYFMETAYFFESRILAQAVHHNHLWLARKLNWEIVQFSTKSNPIEPIGVWPAVFRRYEMRMRQPHIAGCDWNYSAIGQVRSTQIHHNKLVITERMFTEQE